MEIYTCHVDAEQCCGLEKLLSEWNGCGMAWARHRRDMGCVYQTWPHCVNETGKTVWQGNSMICVN